MDNVFSSRQILDLLHDPLFCTLVQNAQETSPLWEAFRYEPMPCGLSPEETWAILTAMRKQTAHVFAFPSFIYPDGPTDIWCTPNSSISSLQTQISSMAQLCRNRSIEKSADRFLLTDAIARDLSAAMMRDGVLIDPKRIRELATSRQPIRSDEECLTANALELIGRIPHLTRRRFTPWVFDDLIEHLDEGCEQLPGICEPQRPCATFYRHIDDETAVETICDGLNNAVGSRRTALMDMLLFSGIIWDLFPFPRWNGILELLARHIFFVRSGQALLRFVPFSALSLKWERGETSPGEIPYKWAVHNPNCGEGSDVSPYIECYLTMFEHALSTLIETIDEKQHRGESLHDSIERHSELNFRQKGFLREAALSDSDQIYDIKTHRAVYDIAYATARSDLLALADMGYLVRYREGKTILFKPSPKLMERLQIP